MTHANIISLNDGNFEAVVQSSDRPILVKFEAPWCGPCKAMKPMIDEIAAEYCDRVTIATLDIDSNGKTPHKFGIRGVPTLMMFNDGKVVGQKIGMARKQEVAALIQPHVADVEHTVSNTP